MNTWEKKFYACNCGNEAILLSVDNEFPYIYFTIFEHGRYKDSRIPFWARFSWALNLLKTGHPYKDEIVLDLETAKELGQELLRTQKEWKKEIFPGKAEDANRSQNKETII
jgi:hypothetical protein